MSTDATPRELRLTAIYTVTLGVLVAAYRLMPYYLFDPNDRFVWNLVPVGALALFAGSRLRGWHAFFVPLGAMLVSDLLLIAPLARIGFASLSPGTPLIYASFAVYVLIGRLIRHNELSPIVIGGAALLAGVQFFLVTNFAVWLRGDMFPHTLTGLLGCYGFALPFYRNTVASDLFFSALFFGVHAGLLWAASLRKASQLA